MLRSALKGLLILAVVSSVAMSQNTGLKNCSSWWLRCHVRPGTLEDPAFVAQWTKLSAGCRGCMPELAPSVDSQGVSGAPELSALGDVAGVNDTTNH